MGLFGGKKSKDDDKSTDEATESAKDAPVDKGYKSEPKKAQPWLERAHSVADTQNYDYAIDCFLNGLKHDLDNMAEHEALMEIAQKRLVSNGKPHKGWGGGGKTTVDKLMHAEMLWAKDPHNVKHALTVMEKAAEINRAEEHFDLNEFVVWAGDWVVRLNSTKKDKKTYIRAMELFREIDAYSQAIGCARMALNLAPGEGPLLSMLKDMEAEKAIADSKLDEEGDFKKSVKNLKEIQDLDEGDKLTHADDKQDEIIDQRRATHLADLEDMDAVEKFVRELVRKGTDSTEEEAIEVLQKTFDATGQYRFKMSIGDIKIKQFRRYLTMFKTKVTEDPDNAAMWQDELDNIRKEQLEFELGEFEERTKNYPTDMRMRFQYGKRLLSLKRYEDAVESFQDSQTDPKLKVPSKEALGVCYIAMEWLDSAIDTLKEGIELYPLKDDDLGMGMRYLLVDALEQQAVKVKSLDHAREAQQLANEILQVNIRYRDIRDRVENLKKIVAELMDDKAA